MTVSGKFAVFWVSLLILAFLAAGCVEAEQPALPTASATASQPAEALATPQPSSTNTAVPTPTATTAPTQTPTQTPTPTATAVSAHLFGNPRTIRLTSTPEAKSGAPCGLVDIFDFPIDPPDAANVSRGGGDFGIFRQRYDKYHAGEDWGAPGPGSNLGKPVFSVGHGRVMYAQPEGWNRDKGVVIVEHVVEMQGVREIIYSFYGHLDPPSVVLAPGACVRRGEQVGNIGKPRTSPHLHFEMRTHMPYAPGPGYWEEDPTTAGWRPPSQTIWNQRMASSPGVLWLRPFSPPGAQPIGPWQNDTFLTIENGRLTATHLETGIAQASPLTDADIDAALIHPQTGVLFLLTQENTLLAFADDLLWTYAVAGNGRSSLLPLPGGGVLVAGMRETRGLSVAGAVLWQVDRAERPFAWTLTDEQLIYTSHTPNTGVWAVDSTNPPAAITDKTGYPVASGETTWLYAADGLYRLHLQAKFEERLYTLPSAILHDSQSAPLADGGLLLAHTDSADRRLIAFNEDGSLRWDVSIANLTTGGKIRLTTTATSTLLFTEVGGSGDVQTFLYDVDPSTGDLAYLFHGGSRPFAWNETWIMPAGPSQLILNSAGGSILALDPREAETAVTAASPPN